MNFGSKKYFSNNYPKEEFSEALILANKLKNDPDNENLKIDFVEKLLGFVWKANWSSTWKRGQGTLFIQMSRALAQYAGFELKLINELSEKTSLWD